MLFNMQPAFRFQATARVPGIPGIPGIPGSQDPSAMAEPQRAKIRVTGVVKRSSVPAAEVRVDGENRKFHGANQVPPMENDDK